MPVDLKEDWHGAPKWVWIGGGTILAFTGFILYRRWRAARDAGSTAPTLENIASPQAYMPGDTLPGPGGIGGGGGFGSVLPPSAPNEPFNPLDPYDNGDPAYDPTNIIYPPQPPSNSTLVPVAPVLSIVPPQAPSNAAFYQTRDASGWTGTPNATDFARTLPGVAPGQNATAVDAQGFRYFPTEDGSSDYYVNDLGTIRVVPSSQRSGISFR